MKSYILTAVLLPKERKRFEQHLGQHGRTVLLSIFQQLKKSVKRKQPPQEKVLFQRVFDKPYQEEEAHKLQRELQLLNSELELFLATIREEEQTELKEQLYLLELLADRQAWDLWDKIWNRALRQAEREVDYNQKWMLLQEGFKVRHQREEISVDLLTEMQQLLEDVASEQLKGLGEQLLDLRIQQSRIGANLSCADPSYEAQVPDTYLAPALFEEDPLHRYLDLRARIYFMKGEAKIKALQQALALQDEVESMREQYKKSRYLLLNSIAVEYSKQLKWQAADDAYREMRPFLMEQKDLSNAKRVYNYMMNSLYLGDYRDVLELYTDYAEIVTPQQKLHPSYLRAACWAYIFLGENEKGQQFLPNASQKHSDLDNYSASLQQAILYYQMGKWEESERELIHLQQQLHHKKQELNKQLELQVKAMLDVLKIASSTAPESQKQGQRKALIEAISTKIRKPGQAVTVFWHWLTYQVAQDTD